MNDITISKELKKALYEIYDNGITNYFDITSFSRMKLCGLYFSSLSPLDKFDILNEIEESKQECIFNEITGCLKTAALGNEYKKQSIGDLLVCGIFNRLSEILWEIFNEQLNYYNLANLDQLNCSSRYGRNEDDMDRHI